MATVTEVLTVGTDSVNLIDGVKAGTWNVEGMEQSEINEIQVRNFEYRTEDEITDFENTKSAVVNKEGIQLGVIAQEIETVLPDMVETQSTGVKTVNPDNMTWYLVNAVKELSAQVEELKAKLNEGE